MFVRFSKRNGNPNNEKKYRRAVAIGNTYLVQEGENIVAFGRLKHNSSREYKIWVVDCDHTTELERYVKRFIGNSVKWENVSSVGCIRRKYNVLYIGQDEMNNHKFSIQTI
jgi:hypothetical protein